MGPVTRVVVVAYPATVSATATRSARSGDLHSWRSLDTGQDRVDAPARERSDRIVTTHLTQLPHCRHGEVVVGVLQLGTSGGGESIPLRGPAASVVLPGTLRRSIRRRRFRRAHRGVGAHRPPRCPAGRRSRLRWWDPRGGVGRSIRGCAHRRSTRQWSQSSPPCGFSQHHCDGIPQTGLGRQPLGSRLTTLLAWPPAVRR